MTMTNAQAALIAAANAAVRGSAVPLEPVLKRAAAYLQWLDAQDAPEPVKEAEAAPAEVRRAITQCTSTSDAYTRCLLAAGHLLPHRNSTDGVHWDDKGEEWDSKAKADRPVHFITAPGSAETVCGRATGVTEHGKRKTTTTVADVTCINCKTELGL